MQLAPGRLGPSEFAAKREQIHRKVLSVRVTVLCAVLLVLLGRGSIYHWGAQSDHGHHGRAMLVKQEDLVSVTSEAKVMLSASDAQRHTPWVGCRTHRCTALTSAPSPSIRSVPLSRSTARQVGLYKASCATLDS